MDQKKIGEFIKKERLNNNMTQVQFSEKLGVTEKTIGNWEHARSMPDISILKDICNVLNIEVDELINGERHSSYRPCKINFNDPRSFGLLIYNRRKELGITQYELSSKLLVTRSCISAIERGIYIPSSKFLFQICSVLKLNISEIIL